MKIEVNRNVLAGALIALGKLVCRTSPVEVYRCVQIEKENTGWLYFRTCNPDEMLEFRIWNECEGEFVSVVSFDELRNAVRGSKNKSLDFEYEAGVLQIDSKSMTPVNCDWPVAIEPPDDVNPKVLPDNILEMLKAAAPIVNRNEPRRVLQGINLSRDGVTATNGKELVNIECQLGVDSLTIPFPLALLSVKDAAGGLLSVWQNKVEWLFKMSLQQWTWTAKALPGMYPNWQLVIPAQQNLSHSVSFLPERGEQLAIFLKNVPDNPPHNAVEVYMTGTEYLDLKAGSMKTSVSAESPCDWGDFSFQIDKHLLLRLLTTGYTKIEACDNHAPIVATGGIGRYVAMPLFVKKEENQIQKEESKMETNENKVVSAPMQTVAPNINNEPENNPMDDLVNGIEAFKNKLKAAFDETSLLARKVKEIQLVQKQKERDFVLAKRAIERIRMVSSF